ncbi:MAG: glutamine synthetase [Gammaproteobacteria bacterium]|nr:glutamine synthetase [Gammaproteobacteria bacterium]
MSLFHTAADALAHIDDKALSHVKMGVSDIDGILRGKYLARDKFASVLDGGLGFCDVVLGWDSNDQLYDNVRYTGWHTAYPDATVRLLPETGRRLPLEGEMLFFLGEFSGAAEAICPRGLLRRMVAKAQAMGYEPYGALEYEFFLFDETPHSVREKGYRNLKPITPGYFGYSVLRSTVHAEFYHELLALSQAMDMPIEGLHTETGPGVIEAALGVDKLMNAGDKAILFKTFTKALAQRKGMMATFMAKWSNHYPGQSGHIHLSLKNRTTGKGVFFEPGADHHMSAIQRHFLAGVQRLLPEFLCLFAQTVNAYSRLIPGFWAPTDASWGYENRTTALRVIEGSEKSQRIEVRIGSADANPYIALAAALGAGLYGIEQGWEPTPVTLGNAYEQTFPPEQSFPHTLMDAASRLRASEAARALFGADFVEHYAATREWEEREFRKHITDWELARYFEII